MWVSIKPDGPLFLRGHGEFDPSARGPIPFGRSLTWPRPGTIAGAIASLAYRERGTSPSTPWEDLKLVAGILEDAGISSIWGPLLRYKDEVYVPLWARGLKIVKLSSLRTLAGSVERGCLSIAEGLDIRNIQYVGTALLSRELGQKRVREGHLFIRNMTSFPPGTEFLLELRGSPSIPLPSRVKFGGEGRIAKVAETEPVELPKEGNRLLLLSPAPIRSGSNFLISGSIDVVGLGFSLARRKRRPLVRAILEGSILKLSSTDNVYNLLDHPFGLTLKRLGYGSSLSL